MKTTLALICTALCCAVASAFAVAPPDTVTSMAFGYPDCDTHVGSVGLSGDAANDVYVQTHTTLTSGGGDVTDGKVHLFIATDGLGNPTSVAGNVLWVNLSAGGQDVDGTGHACFPLNLDDLSAFGLNPVTCSTGLVGFQGQYIGQGSAKNSTVQTDLTIQCGDCGTLTNLTIGLEQTLGLGNPPPGYDGCANGGWTYVLTVQNCTPFDLTGVKAQGGTAGWLDASQTTATAPFGSISIKNNNKNQVITWIGDLDSGESVDITVHVCGKIKASTACGTLMFLSGPWSATYTDPDTGLPVKTDYTGRAQLTVTCPP
jgi:hypothetical protein